MERQPHGIELQETSTSRNVEPKALPQSNPLYNGAPPADDQGLQNQKVKDLLNQGLGLQTSLGIVLKSVLPTAIFVAFFSGMGYGEEVYNFLFDHYDLSFYILGVSFATICVLYFLDFSLWSDRWQPLKVFWMAVCMLEVAFGAILSSKAAPHAPIALLMVIIPGTVMYVKFSLETHLEHVYACLYLRATSQVFMITGICVASGWVIWWVDGTQFWNDETKLHYYERMDCPTAPLNASLAMLREDPEAEGELVFLGAQPRYEEACLGAFLLWISPVIAAMACVAYGSCFYLMCLSIENDLKSGRLTAQLKAFTGLLALAAISLWVAASITATGMELARVVITLFMLFLTLLAIIIGNAFGWETIAQQVLQIPLISKIRQSLISDWTKALFCLTCIPFLAAYAAVSCVNQRVRDLQRCLAPALLACPNTEGGGVVTRAAGEQFAQMRTWNWSSVLVKMQWVAVLCFVAIAGGGRITTLFLAWLGDSIERAGMHWLAVDGVFVFIGLTMFLLPPVPGVPVYLTGGVVMTRAAEGELGFIGALSVACAVCFLTKLLAIVLQQKVIGEMLGTSVHIRWRVGINNVSIRATRRILEVPGLSAQKVAILVGGPDWPTSVFTGILKLNVFQMLLGSLPVILLICPTCAAGAFQLRRAEGGIWEALAGVMLAIAAMVQAFALLVAAYYIEQVASEHFEDVEAMAADEEVEALDRAKAAELEAFEALTHWHSGRLPAPLAAALVFSALTLDAVCFLLVIAPTYLFREFEVTDTISCYAANEGKSPEVKCLEGNGLRLLKMGGWIAVGLFFVDCLILHQYYRWAARALEAEKAGGGSNGGGSVGEAVGDAPDAP